MRKAAPFLALAVTLCAGAGFMRLWWMRQGLERLYVLDYARFTFGLPSYKFWPYRIEQVYHLSPVYLPQIFHGEPLYMVLLWPLLGTMAALMLSVFAALALSEGNGIQQGRVLRGPKLISNLAWKWRMMGKKKGFYIAQ